MKNDERDRYQEHDPDFDRDRYEPNDKRFHEPYRAEDEWQYERETYEWEVDPDRRRGVGAVAVVAAIAVLVSALGGAVWLALNSYVVLPKATASRELITAAPVLNSVELAADVDLQDKHFSLEEAALLPSTSEKEALSIREIARTVKPAVVAITTDISVRNYLGDVYQMQAAGSGFILSEEGYVVTNAHVIDRASGIKVYLEDGRTFDAAIVGADEQTDVAVLKIEADDLTIVSLGDSDQLEVGELAVAIGNPTGRLSGTVTAGIISALNRQVDDFSLPLIQTDATINQGNSGGALINSYGEVIGINTLKIMTTRSGLSTNTFEGLNFAIPINEAKPIIEALIQDGRVRRATIGIDIITITEEMAEMNPDLVPGVLVRGVQTGSAAEDAGLSIGDTIIRFDGKDIETSDELRIARDEAALGSSVDVTVLRNGREFTFRLEMREE